MTSASLASRASALLRSEPSMASGWIFSRNAAGFLEPVLLLTVGGSAYGAAMGLWRDPLLAAYVAIKLPLLLVLTALTNAVLNGLWARRLGLDLTFAQSLRAVLLAFGVAGIVLGSFALVILLFDLTLPGPESVGARVGHDVLALSHVLAIAVAGIAAVRRQQRWLREACPSAAHDDRVVLSWLAVNLIVGAQLSWNLRPWFGTPGMEVEFLREDAFQGTLYESVYRMVLYHF
ncbi:MAG: hypothetical protein ACKVXR_08210 [Planctomycetota bacterium]